MAHDQPLLALTPGAVSARAREVVRIAGAAGDTDTAWCDVLSELVDLGPCDLVQVAATLAVALARGEIVLLGHQRGCRRGRWLTCASAAPRTTTGPRRGWRRDTP